MDALSKGLDTETILLVEDNPVSAKVQTKLLSNKGFNVDAVENGNDALHAVQEKQYALILMDINMPVLNGYDATKLIRDWQRASSQPNTPIVALTVHDMPANKSEYQNKGIDHFIKKPLEDEDIQYLASMLS